MADRMKEAGVVGEELLQPQWKATLFWFAKSVRMSTADVEACGMLFQQQAFV
jgi:hypothetical protein